MSQWWEHERYDEHFGRERRCDFKRRRMTRGDTLQFQVQVLAPPPGPLPPCDDVLVPANITGWYMWCTLKYQWPDQDAQAIAQVTSLPRSSPSGGGILFTLPLSGYALVTVPSLATANMPDSDVDVVYDVQVQDLSVPVITTHVERGIITVVPSATRSSVQP